jgi:hypothetical protein
MNSQVQQVSPVLMPSSVKDESLLLERLPEGQCELNYCQENPVLLPFCFKIRYAFLAVLLSILVLYLCGSSPARIVMATVIISSMLVYVSIRVLQVAISWLTSQSGVSVETRQKYQEFLAQGVLPYWHLCNFPTSKNHLCLRHRINMQFFIFSCIMISLMLLMQLTGIGGGVLYFVLYAVPVVVVVAAAGCELEKHKLSLRSVWFFARLTLLPLAKPQPPWVIVLSPRAKRLQALCVVCIVLSAGVFLAPLRLYGQDTIPFTLVMILAFFSLAYSAVFLVAVAVYILSPVLAELDRVIVPDADTSPLDSYSEKLRTSNNALERDCLFMGTHPTKDFPFLLQSKMLCEHMHILGAPGSGKTSIGLMSLMMQLVRKNDGAVVVIDLKGDPLLFHTARLEAEATGRSFKYFTNLPNRATYVFNPFDREIYDKLTLMDAVGLLVNSLNLSHGSDYGRAWFSTASRILLKRAFEAAYPSAETPKRRGRPKKRHATAPNPIESFADLNLVIQYLMNGKDGKNYEAAKHLSFVVEQLSEMEQLNLAPDRLSGECHPALEQAIHMPEVLREKSVVYFYLGGLVDSAAAGELGRLAIYALLTACSQHFDTHGATRAYCLVDEAQSVIAQNISNVLAKARSYGLSMTLAHQSMSQLNPPGGADLREIVTNCTATKQYFAVRDMETIRRISFLSGQTRYANLAYSNGVESLQAGRIGFSEIVPDETGVTGVKVVESVGERLTPHDIQTIGSDPERCILAFEQGMGLTQYLGYFPAKVTWPISKEKAEERAAMPWPASSEATIIVTPSWKAGNTQPERPESISSLVEDSERLNQLKDILDLDSEI